MKRLKLKLQLYCGEEIAFGPGKADLLEAIARTGSISAAARAMGLSYRRAWMMVDVMNRCFTEKLVDTTPGGGQKAGARVSEAGTRALAAYRDLQQRVTGAVPASGDALQAMLREEPEPPEA
ncbi:LysR family transcriptional regulator [Aurantiacibacter xanthus]|uniref:LysR family transcriptional regulator n=1 Tax=Aurantiacibacter xanthus TaxID=1784712 RepID=A0A3A1P6H7_9SPHN|nr:LysR family transcriptional regulator [Aurantiacibacter xanthus]RIV88251.1 LysR family transcriptional regulator [Aurantiacibacter xanthus]